MQTPASGGPGWGQSPFLRYRPAGRRGLCLAGRQTEVGACILSESGHFLIQVTQFEER